jgi:hypothetical protein
VTLVKIGKETKFIPFRKPAVGEKLEVQCKEEEGGKFGYVVRVPGP